MKGFRPRRSLGPNGGGFRRLFLFSVRVHTVMEAGIRELLAAFREWGSGLDERGTQALLSVNMFCQSSVLAAMKALALGLASLRMPPG